MCNICYLLSSFTLIKWVRIVNIGCLCVRKTYQFVLDKLRRLLVLIKKGIFLKLMFSYFLFILKYLLVTKSI